MAKDSWEAECRGLLENWQLERDTVKEAKTQIPKKPQMPVRLKKPTKPCPGRLLDMCNIGDAPDNAPDDVDGSSEANDSESELEAVTKRMR